MIEEQAKQSCNKQEQWALSVSHSDYHIQNGPFKRNLASLYTLQHCVCLLAYFEQYLVFWLNLVLTVKSAHRILNFWGCYVFNFKICCN
jgi:hypothetical protein